MILAKLGQKQRTGNVLGGGKKNMAWHLYMMEYYSAIKKNEITPSVVTWMDLETS